MDQSPISFTISVLSYNRLDDLEKTLRHLEVIDYPNFEVVILDQNSTDGSRELLESLGDRYRVIFEDDNIGIARGRQKILDNSNGELVFTIDDDSYPTPDVLRKAAQWFEMNPNLGGIACNIVPIDYRFDGEDVPPGDIAGLKNHLFTGSGAIHRRDALSYGYDDDHWFGCEDLDLSLQIISNGFKVIQVSDLIVHHAYSPVNRIYNHKVRQMLTSRINVVFKYFPKRLAWRFLASYIRDAIRYSVLHRNTDYLRLLADIRPKHRIPIPYGIAKEILVTYKDIFGYYKCTDFEEVAEAELDAEEVVVIKSVAIIPMYNLMQKLDRQDITVVSHDRSSDFFNGWRVIVYDDNKEFKSLRHLRGPKPSKSSNIIIPIYNNDKRTVSNIRGMMKGYRKVHYYNCTSDRFVL